MGASLLAATATQSGRRTGSRNTPASSIAEVTFGQRGVLAPNVVVHSAGTIGEQIGLVRRALSLTTAHVATILGVSRPTLYAWQHEVPQAVRRQDAIARLSQLANWAARWESWNVGRLGMASVNSMPEGLSLWALLQQTPWDHGNIEQAFVWLRRNAENKQTRAGSRPSASTALQRLRARTQTDAGTADQVGESLKSTMLRFEEQSR